MKRSSTALVSYTSSDDESESLKTEDALPEPQLKKRKLPALPSGLVPFSRIDNPALHQGRIRTTPHAEGQYAAYVYVPLIIDRHSPLHKFLSTVTTHARTMVPTLHSIGISDISAESCNAVNGNKSINELHISLTRPVFLYSHQRDVLKRAVKNIATSHSPFSASFAAFSELVNDERTRTFLTMEVGAGHAEFKALSDALIPTLHSIRQKEFYQDPRFHASIGWALLEIPRSPVVNIQPSTSAEDSSMNTEIEATEFPTIPHLPPELVPSINNEFGPTLLSAPVGSFQVRQIYVRIGKDISRWDLVG